MQVMLRTFLFVTVLFSATSVFAQCHCTSELDTMATEIVQLQQAVNQATLRALKAEALAQQTGRIILEMRQRLWPGFRRGAARLEEIYSDVEAGLP